MKIFGTTIKFYEDINSAEFYAFWGAVLLLFIIVLVIGVILDKKKNSVKVIEKEETVDKEEKIEAEEKPISVKVEAPKEVKEEVQNIQKGEDSVLIAKDVESDSAEEFRKAFFKKEEKEPSTIKEEETVVDGKTIEPPVMIKMPVRQIPKPEPIKVAEKAEVVPALNSVVIPQEKEEPVPTVNRFIEPQGKEVNNDYQALLELNKLSGKYNVGEDELKQFKPINLVEPKKIEPLKNETKIEEVAKKIEKDVENNKTIGFTEFEERQEEDAIISYDELIKNARQEEVHEPVMVKTTTNKTIDVEPLIDEVQDIDDFLRQLRDLRNNM